MERLFCRSGIIQIRRRQGRLRRCSGEHEQNVSQMRRCVASQSFRFCCRKCRLEGSADIADANNILRRGQRLRACGERLCTARAQVKRPSRKSCAGQQQKPSEEIPMRLKTHKDSVGNLRSNDMDHPRTQCVTTKRCAIMGVYQPRRRSMSCQRRIHEMRWIRRSRTPSSALILLRQTAPLQRCLVPMTSWG